MRDRESDIWIWDLTRETLTRLTSEPTFEGSPLWTPDGRRIVFVSTRAGPVNLFSVSADGTGAIDRLTEVATGQTPDSFSPDGSLLVVREDTGATNQDLILLATSGDRKATPLLQTKFNESNAEVSPDGRWMAYQSDESGQYEVYVRPFPDVDAGRWQVSTGAARIRCGRGTAASCSMPRPTAPSWTCRSSSPRDSVRERRESSSRCAASSSTPRTEPSTSRPTARGS
ncbi:MAG: PD40 domain-containing protein [Acidobacteria bacterium]|nr:PD40 domain-containing protein [Acidobacteriota bacterium]